MKNKLFWAAVFIGALASFAVTSTAVAQLGIQYLGQLQPPTLPANVAFGGGGNVFERRVDLSGSLAVVGAGRFRSGADQGYAFVYNFSNPASIQQIATLRASDNSAGNEFGDGVAISGNYVFVGAHGDSGNRGAVYMYDVSDLLHIVERKITAFDAAPNNEFGLSLAVDGNRLIVGAPKFTLSSLPSAAYLIDFSNPNNITQKKIATSTDFSFGQSVALSGNYAIVGQPNDSAAFPFAGSAHLYDLTNLNSIVDKRLTPTDAPNYDGFGERVAISGTRALVSVTSDPGPTNNAGNFDGAVWAFDFSNWNSIPQKEYGRPTNPPPESPFGRWLDLQGNLGIEAAFNEDGGRGALYFHDVSNTLSPTQLLRLPSHLTTDSEFGVSLAIDGSSLLVSDVNGRVYLYQLVPEAGCLQLLAIGLSCTIAWRKRRRSRNA